MTTRSQAAAASHNLSRFALASMLLVAPLAALLAVAPGAAPDAAPPPATASPIAPGTASPIAPGPASTATPSPATTTRYAWPLAHPPRLSATFGEYRPGHFHAGIDLSTSGREGIPVLAVDDGTVVRVRASGAGYGRAIYVQLRDGRLAVYAHLSAFMEPLASYVEAVQDSLGRYRVDLNPPPGRFPVRRGQTIGKSGSSGQGPAHFHFELRSGDIALNPLTHGLATADARGPVLTALHLVPLGAGAEVNGAARRLRAPLRRAETGATLRTPGEIRVRGRVAVAVQGYDQNGDPGNYLGIYRTELLVNGERRAVTAFDRFDYLRNHEVEAEYDFEEARAGRRTVQNLFVPPGVTGDFHDGLPPWSGVLVGAGTDSGAPADAAAVLAPGAYRLRVVATDAFGNATAAEATVRVEPDAATAHGRAGVEPTLAGSVPPVSGPALARPTWTLEPATRVAVLTLDFDAAPPRSPWLVLPGARAPIPATATRPAAESDAARGARYVVRFDARGQSPLLLRAPAAAGGFTEESFAPPWCPAPRATGGRLLALDGRVLVECGPEAFFEDAYLWAGVDPRPSALSAGLEALSAVFRVEPVGLPLDQGVWVGAEPTPGAAGAGVALYRIDGEATNYVGAERRGRHIGAEVKRLARFVLARDTRPPVVNILSPADSIVAAGGRPLLRARVRDLESGFREDDLTFTIDGRRVPSEWNPDASDLRYRLRAPLARGRHVITAEAVDRAGNATRRTLTLRVR